MACSSSEGSSVERPVCSCAEVCFDNLSRGLVCFIIPICNHNITCLVRNLFPGFIPAFLRRYPWLYNIESRFTQMQEERVKVLVELSRTTFQVCRHKGWTCFPVNFLFKKLRLVQVCIQCNFDHFVAFYNLFRSIEAESYSTWGKTTSLDKPPTTKVRIF